MKTKFIDKEIVYNGSQLSSHFAYKNFNIAGNSVISFIGPVKVELSKMVDIQDVINHEPIASDSMLNFIVEIFDMGFYAAIWMQRALMSIIMDIINERSSKLIVSRKGDDLYYDERKLSVSIATVSPVSSLIHCALNIVTTGAPIPIAGLNEINIDPHWLAETVMGNFADEFEDVKFARVKVNWVG